MVEIVIKGRLPPEHGQKKGVIREIQGTGSGVVHDESHGYIVTNSHVIDHADEITVTLTDGRVFKAKRVGGDPDFDLAVVQVPTEELTSIPL